MKNAPLYDLTAVPGGFLKRVSATDDSLDVIPGYDLEIDASKFALVDPTDRTKKLVATLSGNATGTTMDLGTGAGGLRTIVDTGGAFATPIVLTAADSGKWYLLDDAAGLDFTLPAVAAAQIGIHYTFLVNVTNTSNSYRITAAAGDLFRGHVLISDFDAAYTAPQILAAEADESNDVIMTMAAVAQGGRAGGWFDMTAIHATGWFVRGQLLGDGVIVTVFS